MDFKTTGGENKKPNGMLMLLYAGCETKQLKRTHSISKVENETDGVYLI